MIQTVRAAATVAGAVAWAALAVGAAPARTPAAAPPSLQRVEASEPHMGTLVRVVAYAPSRDAGDAAARAAFARIAALDARLSDYRDDSEVAALGRAAVGVPVPVSADLFVLLQASIDLARRSDGAFDVTAGRLTHLWRRARRVNVLPSAAEVEAARRAGGYTHIRLDPIRRTATLAVAGLELDLGGIAKGYAADQAVAAMRAQGIGAALVAIGGDIAAGDPPPGRTAWTVAVPRVGGDRTAPLADEAHWIELAHAAVSTSGDAEQWMTVAGVRYSHVLDLRTGWPLTGRRATSVVAARGLDADALDTAIGVLDDAAGAALVAGAPGPGRRPAALWQQAAADGTVATHQTSNWPAIAGPAPTVTP